LSEGIQEEIMKTYYTITLSMLAGAAVGAVAIQGLRAQVKPTAYVIAEIDVTNQDAYVKEFVPINQKALRDSGAKYLARGGKIVVIDGEPPKALTAVLAFENIDKAQAALTSPAYKEAREIGNKYAKFRIFILEGLPQ
jgi:uncharacterized protein (DUF1330 family)